MAVGEDLAGLLREFGLPDRVLRVFQEKAVTSINAVIRTFEDDEEFADFIMQQELGSKSLRLRLALKMVYMEAVQRGRRNGQVPRMSSSPVSSSAPSREASENGDDVEDPQTEDDEEVAPPPPPPPPPPPEALGPAWRP
mmetsp:Transcript_42054/g.78126  ORF Transcript_42054/g.78126 Transcript_42054/m.78126 type:complete len:139 (-) Transcript_42054:105-521(-)